MKILVTAGPTREPLDPVRFISNRSSGKMGYAVADAAIRRGHQVVLVTGPVSLHPPHKAKVIKVVTSGEMLRAVARHLSGCRVLVMAAAVSDWRPVRIRKRKIKKRKGSILLRLVPTRDILRTLRAKKGDRLFIGFAAETGALIREARRKLKEKGLDLMVANDVSRPDAGFEVDTNRVVLLGRDGMLEEWPTMTKAAVAGRLLRRIERRETMASKINQQKTRE